MPGANALTKIIYSVLVRLIGHQFFSISLALFLQLRIIELLLSFDLKKFLFVKSFNRIYMYQSSYEGPKNVSNVGVRSSWPVVDLSI